MRVIYHAPKWIMKKTNIEQEIIDMLSQPVFPEQSVRSTEKISTVLSMLSYIQASS